MSASMKSLSQDARLAMFEWIKTGTAQEIADELGVTLRTVQNWRRGFNVSGEHMLRMAIVWRQPFIDDVLSRIVGNERSIQQQLDDLKKGIELVSHEYARELGVPETVAQAVTHYVRPDEAQAITIPSKEGAKPKSGLASLKAIYPIALFFLALVPTIYLTVSSVNSDVITVRNWRPAASRSVKTRGA